MDANRSRYHLLLGPSDWARCFTVSGKPSFVPGADQVYWNAPRNEVTLWPDTFRFGTTRGVAPLTPNDRRGAARDRFGNWYWIAPDERSIQVASSGSQEVSQFWPAADKCAPAGAGDGGFRASTVVTSSPALLRGLTITEDNYLVAGVVDETAAARGGLEIFDLYSGGPSSERHWPVAFAPFAMSPRAGGGIWVLDADQRRVWELDRRFEIVTSGDAATTPAEAGAFTSVAPAQDAPRVTRGVVRIEQGWLVSGTGALVDVVGLAAGGVLVLEADDGTGFARVHGLRGGVAVGAPASVRSMREHIAVGDGDEPFTLRGHAFTLAAREADDPAEWIGRLLIVGVDGNQAFAFGVRTDGPVLVLEALAEYYPMRLFGGRALVTADGAPWYDCADQWTPVTAQRRPRYTESGEIWTPVFDGGEPGCVWHRLMLDACIPNGAAMDVYTRASDDWHALTLTDWLNVADRERLEATDVPSDGELLNEADLLPWQREPSPYLRSDGSELPYALRESGGGRGTWELLFQRARGRFVQVKLVLRGNGQSTPRVRALRAWYPRFSYLDHYLPAVYREDGDSASFLDRFLANLEGTFTATEDRIAAAQLLFDVSTAPGETLDWLGRWFGVALDPAWTDERRRLFLNHAMEFFAARGTMRGLQMALRLALDECVDDRMFAPVEARRATPVRIIERFRSRHTPPSLLGDVRTAVPGPQLIDAAAQWRPVMGGGELRRRYAEALSLPATADFPLVSPASSTDWRDFAQRALGFIPQLATAERRAWQRWARQRYHESLAEQRAEQGEGSTFAGLRVPLSEPTGAAGITWRAYLASASTVNRGRWQDFLARRYRSVSALTAAWRTSWTAFSNIPLPDQLPPDGPALADWFEFEGTVMAMHGTAHRFTVMLPVPVKLSTDTPAQQRRLALAKAVLELEKPAHTVFDIRFYWSMFRVGEARLGDDTLIDLGSRAPALMGPMVLGEGHLAEVFLSASPGADAPSRLQIGRDRVGRSARLGGP
jgi:phage tail-like protein